MSKVKQQHGVPFSATASGSGSATVTIAGVYCKRHFITDVAVSVSNDDAVMEIKKDDTTLWQLKIKDKQRSPIILRFDTPLIGGKCEAGTVGNVSVTVTATGNCRVNIAGFTH